MLLLTILLNNFREFFHLREYNFAITTVFDDEKYLRKNEQKFEKKSKENA